MQQNCSHHLRYLQEAVHVNPELRQTLDEEKFTLKLLA